MKVYTNKNKQNMEKELTSTENKELLSVPEIVLDQENPSHNFSLFEINNLKIRAGNTEFVLKFDENGLFLESDSTKKYLKEGQEVEFGRADSNQDQTMSSQHFSIRFSGEELIINDKESLNKTILEPELRAGEAEIVDNQVEFDNYTERDLADFADYINNSDIPEVYFSNKYALGEIIYKNFNRNNYQTEVSVEQKIKYQVDLEKIAKFLDEQGIFNVDAGDGWFGSRKISKSNQEAFDQDKKRLYLNPKIDEISKIFKEINQKLSDEDIAYYCKIPKKIKNSSASRSDKMVLYFGGANMDRVMELIAEIHDQNQQSFNPNVPRFSDKIVDGIALADNPDYQDPDNEKFSFGLLRARALAELAIYAKSRQIAKIDFDNSELKNQFKIICDKYNIDSDNMAYNKN